MAFAVNKLPTDHKDLIHDVASDFHGRRLATCSSDQNVKIWDLDNNGEWRCTATWKAHNGSVWRVDWAHPEYGQVIATCSFDRYAAVWEEVDTVDIAGGSQKQWVLRAGLPDSRTSVNDVKFAPKCKQLGLQLATCSSDGVIRFYEALDVMNLSQWSLQHDINCKMVGCSSLSWCVYSNHPPLIAVGCDDSSCPKGGAKVQVFEYNENQRKWMKAATILTIDDPVYDLAFAPNFGRPYHTLAIASKDMHVIGLKPLRARNNESSEMSTSIFDLLQIARSDLPGTQMWRVSWNVIGTVLSTCSDDGIVRLWKANYMGVWKCSSEVKGNGESGVDERVATYSQSASFIGSTVPSARHRPVISPMSAYAIRH